MEPVPFKKLGAIPYQRTGDELSAAPLAAIAPATYNDPAFFTTPILMQGQAPECGGFSLAFTLAYLSSINDKLSGSFSYAYEKTVDGVPNEEGTTIAAIGKAAQAAGSSLYPLFPDDGNATANPQGTQTLWNAATSQAIQDAATRAGWIPLFINDLSWNGLQAAITKYKAVILEVKVGNEWWTAQDGTVKWDAADILPLRTPAQVIDGHFIVAGGKYDPTTIYFANSWSNEWGENGFGYFGQNYLPFVMNAIAFYKMPPAVQTVVNHPTLTQAEKNSLIQQIINDIQAAVQLISKEVG